jgi:membrane-associated protein
MEWLEAFFTGIVDFTAHPLDPKVALLLLAICGIGEAGLTVPLLLETIWMTVGYNTASGNLMWWNTVYLWIAAQIGRQIGAYVLYRVGRLGLPPLEKLYHKVHLDRLFNKLMEKAPAVQKINLTSPFTVAFGRLVGMRIPMTLVLAAKKKFWMLSLGVIIASAIFDGLFIMVGVIMGIQEVKPTYTVLITLGVLVVIYLVTLGVKYISRLRHKALQAIDGEAEENPEEKTTKS